MFCKLKRGETNRILKILTNKKDYNKDERLKNEFKIMMLRTELA